MTTFSPVISRPSNKEQPRPFVSAKPALAMTQMGRGVCQPDHHHTHVSPQPSKASIVGDFWTDTLFNPVWVPTTTRVIASRVSAAAKSICSSPPSLIQDDDYTESSFLSLSSFDVDTPLPTASSTAAVLGSARLSGAFEDDYDRPEASPNFVRKLLRRSRSLRRQARMRDGDFGDSDGEGDSSVASEWDPVVCADAPPQHFSPADASEQVASDVRADRVPSRLSRRVKVPSPINTSHGRAPIGTKNRRKEYEVEVGQADGSELMSSSESGFDADDECDSLRAGAKTQIVAGVNGKGKAAPTLLSTPSKKSYAAIVATSPPRANTPQSKAVVPQVVHAARIPEARRGDGTRAFEWRPFVEPFDV